MAQVADVVLPLVKTGLVNKFTSIDRSPIGTGKKILFQDVPPQEDVETIAASFAHRLSKVANGNYQALEVPSDSDGKFLYVIQELGNTPSETPLELPTVYRIFTGEDYDRQDKKRHPAIAILRDPICDHPAVYIDDFVKEVKQIKS